MGGFQPGFKSVIVRLQVATDTGLVLDGEYMYDFTKTTGQNRGGMIDAAIAIVSAYPDAPSIIQSDVTLLCEPS
jgi:hypothetical protein